MSGLTGGFRTNQLRPYYNHPKCCQWKPSSITSFLRPASKVKASLTYWFHCSGGTVPANTCHEEGPHGQLLFSDSVNHTLSLAKPFFLCPTENKDCVPLFSSLGHQKVACSICTQGKSTHSPPADLFTTLPFWPCQPWTYIAVDFITSLSPSKITLSS